MPAMSDREHIAHWKNNEHTSEFPSVTIQFPEHTINALLRDGFTFVQRMVVVLVLQTGSTSALLKCMK